MTYSTSNNIRDFEFIARKSANQVFNDSLYTRFIKFVPVNNF